MEYELDKINGTISVILYKPSDQLLSVIETSCWKYEGVYQIYRRQDVSGLIVRVNSQTLGNILAFGIRNAFPGEVQYSEFKPLETIVEDDNSIEEEESPGPDHGGPQEQIGESLKEEIDELLDNAQPATDLYYWIL